MITSEHKLKTQETYNVKQDKKERNKNQCLVTKQI